MQNCEPLASKPSQDFSQFMAFKQQAICIQLYLLPAKMKKLAGSA